MDYSYGKFGDCSFSRFGSIMWTDRQTHTHTQTDADERLTPVTLVGVSIMVYPIIRKTSVSLSYAMYRIIINSYSENV